MFEVKQRSSGEYYWILKAPNGQVIARSYNDYVTMAAVHNAIASVKKYAEQAQIITPMEN